MIPFHTPALYLGAALILEGVFLALVFLAVRAALDREWVMAGLLGLGAVVAGSVLGRMVWCLVDPL